MLDKWQWLVERFYNEKMVVLEMQKVELLSKRSYLGFLVFELGKVHMRKNAYPNFHPHDMSL